MNLSFCQCGCGGRVSKVGNSFIKGHQNIGRQHSMETRKKMSDNHADFSGEKNPRFGEKYCHFEETKKKISKARIGKYGGENHPMYGTHLSKEHKQKISNSHADMSGENNPMFGKIQSEETKQKIGNKSRGRIHSEETRQKMSNSHIGEKNHSWKGGISCEPYCQAWADKQFKQDLRGRDGNIAWDIGYWYKGGLSLHHIDFDKKNCHPSNIITVSRGMNAAVNNHREFYTEWFQVAMSHRLGYNYGAC